MKQITALILAAICLFTMLPVNAGASDYSETYVTYFEDGSFLVETIEIGHARASGMKNGTKTQTYYGSAGDAEWKVVLYGSFSYTGSDAICTASSVSVTVYNSDWYIVSKSATKSGATASASVTMGYKLLGVTTKKVVATPTLTCDVNGNLS